MSYNRNNNNKPQSAGGIWINVKKDTETPEIRDQINQAIGILADVGAYLDIKIGNSQNSTRYSGFVSNFKLDGTAAPKSPDIIIRDSIVASGARPAPARPAYQPRFNNNQQAAPAAKRYGATSYAKPVQKSARQEEAEDDGMPIV